MGEIWAVTATSLYCLSIVDGVILLTKVAIRPDAVSKLLPGHIETGASLLLGKILVLFPDTRVPRDMIVRIQESDEPRDFPFCTRTSPVVALFDTEGEGRACLLEPEGELQSCDPRWESETRSVLRRVGTDHPQIVVHERGPLALTWNEEP